MAPLIGRPSTPPRALLTRAVLVLVLAAALLAGCGSTSKSASTAHASASAPGSCPQTVLGALGGVVARAYREGVSSERTATARHLIAASAPLRLAIERGDAPGTQAAAQALVASGHMTNLLVMRGSSKLADVGGAALAPLRGKVKGARGAVIANYVTSVWSDRGFLAEAEGVAEGAIALRAGEESVGGSFALPRGALPPEGSLPVGQLAYQYTSFPAERYPAGSARVYLLKRTPTTEAFCGPSSEDTLVNTLSHVASLIYQGEAGTRTLPQVHRVQHDGPLLRAVARREPAATKIAVEALLNQHIVRLRVLSAGALLADVGGPYVLAPVSAPLRLGGRTIGSFVLSIQDDEGYLRLARRIAGLNVLMYMGAPHPQLVKNSLGPAPGTVPQSGTYHYRGRTFRVFTLHAHAFPSGPLRIAVLIPIPYS